jgi:hypothetical protein
MLSLPSDRPLAGTEGSLVPHFFVGDEVFALNRNILRPFGGYNLSVKKKKVYNYRLYRAQRYVECAFGFLSNKWRIFQRPLNVSPNFAVDIAKACDVLQNFVCKRDNYKYEDAMTATGLERVPDGQSARGGLTANSVRNKAVHYFQTYAGTLPWHVYKI